MYLQSVMLSYEPYVCLLYLLLLLLLQFFFNISRLVSIFSISLFGKRKYMHTHITCHKCKYDIHVLVLFFFLSLSVCVSWKIYLNYACAIEIRGLKATNTIQLITFSVWNMQSIHSSTQHIHHQFITLEWAYLLTRRRRWWIRRGKKIVNKKNRFHFFIQFKVLQKKIEIVTYDIRREKKWTTMNDAAVQSIASMRNKRSRRREKKKLIRMLKMKWKTIRGKVKLWKNWKLP